MSEQANSETASGPVSDLTGLLGHDDGWEALDRYRTEMINNQKKLAKLAANFLELEAFEDSAKCSIKAAGLTYVIGRIPRRPNARINQPASWNFNSNRLAAAGLVE